MKNNLFRNVARIIGISFIIFISIFALDVFSEYQNIADTIVALLIHLIPSFVLTLVLFIAWRKELIGGIFFLIIGTATIFGFHTYEHIVSFLLITVPPLSTGVLFLVNYFKNKKLN